MPSEAASLMVSRLEQATQTGGCGFCNGFGTTLRQGMEKYLPSNPGQGAITIMLRHCSSASRHAARFSANTHTIAAQLEDRSGFSGTELDSPVRNEIERRDTLSDAGWMIVLRRH